MSAIEKECLEATGFKAKTYPDRQDYLAAVARAVDKLKDPVLNPSVSDAADWANSALTAMKEKEELPDFPDLDVTKDEDDDDAADDAAETDDDADDDGDDDDTKEDDNDAEAELDNEEAEAKADAKAQKAGSKVAKVKAAKAAKAEKATPPVKPEKTAKVAPKKKVANFSKAEKDRFGLAKGSHVLLAIELFASKNGAPMSLIREKTGSAQYNVLAKMAQDGHKVEKFEGVIKVTHKDDVGAAPKKKK